MRNEWVFGLLMPAAMLACTNENNQAIAVSAGGFASPILDYDLALDAAMWDDVSESAIPRPLGALLDSWAAVVSPSCLPSVMFVDADGDGVPASYSATFACVNQQSAGSRVTNVTGSVTITDADDHSSASGFSISFNDFVVDVSIPGNSRMRTLNGTIAMVASGGSYQTTRGLTVAFNQAVTSRETLSGTHVMNELAAYIPTAGQADPFASGTVNLSGQGTLTRSFQGVQQSRVVARSTNPALHWNSTCRTADPTAAGYDSGTVLYADDMGGTLQVVFNGCENPTITNNGL